MLASESVKHPDGRISKVFRAGQGPTIVWLHGPHGIRGHDPVIAELEKIMDSGEGGLSQSLVKVQPIARLNAIMVVTSKPALLKSGNAGWVRGFSVDFQALYLTQGFDGESFGNSASMYKSGPQLQGMIGVSYDFGEGIGGRVKK